MTNQEVWDNNEEIDSWPCDVNAETGEEETNGAVEHLMRYEDKTYYIITDWVGDVVLHPHRECYPAMYTTKEDDEF